MSFNRLLASTFVLGALACWGCGAADEPASLDSEPSYEDELVNAEKAGEPSQKWIYNGPLTKLDNVTVTASLKGHTVRVTGFLPKGFAGALPYYAEVKPSGERQKLTVVYPIATGKYDPSTDSAPASPGVYNTLFAVAYTATTVKAPWGGFPFMMYNAKRGIAFHGPITSVTDVGSGDLEWHLYRGAVSHGCNRMAGEHIVEMATLLGIDMTKPHAPSDRYTLGLKTTILEDYDVFDGHTIDVDYPAEASVVRPTGPDVKVYPTWLSDEMPRLVCAYQADRPLGPDHCATAGENRRDLATGIYVVTPSTDPWIGVSCSADTDCAFTASNKPGVCSLGSNGAGVCTIPCEGSCPDRAGSSTTFCATFPDGAGRCVAKAESSNQFCNALPGTGATLADRLIGTSKAKAAKATVCLPK